MTPKNWSGSGAYLAAQYLAEHETPGLTRTPEDDPEDGLEEGLRAALHTLYPHLDGYYNAVEHARQQAWALLMSSFGDDYDFWKDYTEEREADTGHQLAASLAEAYWEQVREIAARRYLGDDHEKLGWYRMRLRDAVAEATRLVQNASVREVTTNPAVSEYTVADEACVDRQTLRKWRHEEAAAQAADKDPASAYEIDLASDHLSGYGGADRLADVIERHIGERPEVITAGRVRMPLRLVDALRDALARTGEGRLDGPGGADGKPSIMRMWTRPNPDLNDPYEAAFPILRATT